ncbi:hypothetical protein [Aliivibrio sp. EL58]|uniref:hypothetical protein n=1 Tax=Aliivibrio sp. EL58 TaxID=2107582 RepID=UPI0013C4A818|nr:hypothetical protein [Aliivibrio sp. EL58]
MKNYRFLTLSLIIMSSSSLAKNDMHHVKDIRNVSSNISLHTKKNDGIDSRLGFTGQVNLGVGLIGLTYNTPAEPFDNDGTIFGKIVINNFVIGSSLNIVNQDYDYMNKLDYSKFSFTGNYVHTGSTGTGNIGIKSTIYEFDLTESSISDSYEFQHTFLTLGYMTYINEFYYRVDFNYDVSEQDILELENKIGWTNQLIDINLAYNYYDYGIGATSQNAPDLSTKNVELSLGMNF